MNAILATRRLSTLIGTMRNSYSHNVIPMIVVTTMTKRGGKVMVLTGVVELPANEQLAARCCVGIAIRANLPGLG